MMLMLTMCLVTLDAASDANPIENLINMFVNADSGTLTELAHMSGNTDASLDIAKKDGEPELSDKNIIRGASAILSVTDSNADLLSTDGDLRNISLGMKLNFVRLMGATKEELRQAVKLSYDLCVSAVAKAFLKKSNCATFKSYTGCGPAAQFITKESLKAIKDAVLPCIVFERISKYNYEASINEKKLKEIKKKGWGRKSTFEKNEEPIRNLLSGLVMFKKEMGNWALFPYLNKQINEATEEIKKLNNKIVIKQRNNEILEKCGMPNQSDEYVQTRIMNNKKLIEKCNREINKLRNTIAESKQQITKRILEGGVPTGATRI